MQDYILAAVGIFVSVVLYFLGYRQTVGAKQERIRTANKDIEKILIRRIVNENYQLSLIDVVRLLRGKANDFKVKVVDLYSEEQLLNLVFTRVIESDFITQQQREEVLSRLLPIIKEYEETIESDIYVNASSFANKFKINDVSRRQILIMTLLASAIGSTLVALTILKEGSLTNELDTLIVTITGSLASITFISIFRKSKESQQEVTLSNRSQKIEAGINFEKDVAKLLSKKKYNVLSAKMNDGFDFLLNHENGKILIEVKVWSDRVPISFIKKSVIRLNDSVESENAKEGIIVIPNPINSKFNVTEFAKVKILTIKELKKYL